MEIAYIAHTESSMLMLDAGGICLSVQSLLGRKAKGEAAERCVGAQYVASMDLATKGGLIDAPQPGCPMLFAKTNSAGKICVVRTGALLSFETVQPATRRSGILPSRATTPAPPGPPPRADDPDAETVPLQRARTTPLPASPPYRPSRTLHVPPPTPRPMTLPRQASGHASAFERANRLTLPPPPPSSSTAPTNVRTQAQRCAPAPSSHAWLRESTAAQGFRSASFRRAR